MKSYIIKRRRGLTGVVLLMLPLFILLVAFNLFGEETGKKPGVKVVPSSSVGQVNNTGMSPASAPVVSAEVALINACGAYTNEIGKDLLGAAKGRLSAAGIRVREDDVVKPISVSIWRFKTYIHYYPGDEAAFEAARKTLGVGKGIKDDTLIKGYMKVILGIDAAARLLPAESGRTPSVYLLNAIGREDAPASFLEDLSEADLTIGAVKSFEAGKGMGGTAVTSVVYYPVGFEAAAAKISEIIGTGNVAVTGAPDIFVVLAPDYSEEEFRAVPDWEPVPDETYEVVIYKTRFIMEVKDSAGKVVAEFPVSIGSNPDLADKKMVGDSRTPEGEFRVSNVHSSSDWRFKNIDLAYGPYFIRLETPGWTGIGIHGTNEPYLLGSPISHGCIRLNSKNVEKLKRAVKVGTKVTIVH